MSTPTDEGGGRAADLGHLVSLVRAGSRYAHITPELVRRIGGEELAKGRRLRDAVKETRSRLHQVAGAFLPARVRYTEWLARLGCAKEAGEAAFRKECRQMMRLHASTRERLPVLEGFWSACLGDLPPIRSVVDVGCGLNPLAVPWMPLAADAVYRALDIYEDLAAFLRGFLPLAGVSGHAHAMDVLAHPPSEPCNLALVLKVVPCAEHLEGGSALRLLDALEARHLLVSFPVHSLGGQEKGMPENYEQRLRTMVTGRPWAIRLLAFETELVFVIDKAPGSAQSASSSTTRKV